MRKFALNTAVILVSVCVALLAVEVYLRLFQPFEMRLKGTEIRLPYFQTYQLNNDWTLDGKLDPVARHTKNGLGFRGPNPPADFDAALTVLMVGGSTTECFYIDDAKTWPYLTDQGLQPEFSNLWVNNAGLDGHSSFGHLHLFDQHLKALAPDVIVYLVGGNDMNGLIKQTRYDDTLNLSPELDPNRRNPVFREWVAKNSELAAMLLELYERNKIDLIKGSNLIDFHHMPETEAVGIDADTLATQQQEYIPFYRERLELLIRKSLDAGILPVLVTHPAAFGPEGQIDPATGLNLGRVPYMGMNGATAWAVLESYNDVTRETARSFGIPLIDLARDLPKNTDHYIDQIHFAIPGTRAIGAFMAKRLCPILAEHFPDHATGQCPE